MTNNPLKILIVDDDPAILDLTSLQLQSLGYTIVKAHDGVEGIKAAFEHKPDLILLDVMMPRMDGFQVCRFLKNYPPYDRIPIVFLTVRTGIGDRQRGLLRGGDDYISKPFDSEEIKQKIDMLTQHRAMHRDVAAAETADKVKELSDLSAVLKLGELLDENLYKLNILEEMSRAVADSVSPETIIKILLIGCMSDIGLGFDRAIYLVKSDTGAKLVGHTALGAYPESGLELTQWREVIKRVKDKTLREVYAYDMDIFPFQKSEGNRFVAELTLPIPDGTRTYDLNTIPHGEDVVFIAGKITECAVLTFGSECLSAIPVVAKGQLIGFLVVDNFFSRRPVTTEDIKNLIILCNQVGLALERCRLLEEQTRWTRELERLSNLNLSIIHGAGIGIIYLDSSGNIITWNRTMNRLTGRDTYRVLGKGFFEVFPQLADSFVSKRLEKVMASKTEERVGHLQVNLGRKNGYFDVKMNPVITRGNLQGVIMLIEDISTRVELENKNREVFQYLSGIIDFSADAIITTDVHGKVRTWNRGASDIFGFGEEAVRGKNISILFPHGKDVESSDIVARAAKGETIQDHEIMLLASSGSRLYVSLTATPLRKADNSIYAISFFFRNITERKRLIAQLVQTEKLASLGVMAAGMAHEINNPLTSIVMHGQLLAATNDLTPEGHGYLSKISEEVERISDIVNDLLVYSRNRDRKSELVSLNLVLDQAILFIRRKTASQGVTVEFSPDKLVPPVEGQPNELLEIFLNLLLNAADALQGGGMIRVRIALESSADEAAAWIRIEVEDTGHGIPESELPKIFDPFYTTKPPGKGTGLGLMVVNQLVTKYGGQVEVKSAIGVGTTFTVRLRPADSQQGEAG